MPHPAMILRTSRRRRAGCDHATMTPLTADILADRAAAAPDPVADPARWVYRKSAVVSVPEMAREPEVTERWTTADGTAAAVYVDGQLETTSSLEVPAISYASLRELPSDPAALAQLLADTPVHRDDDAWNPGHAFEMAVALLESYIVPPSVAASLYRALGQLPGIAVIADAADAAGRRGPAFLLAGQPGGNQLLSVSAADCRFAGYQFLGRGLDLAGENAWGVAILEIATVTGPGRYP
jgi:hypothetical protein